MPISPSTLAAINTAKTTNVLGAAALVSVNASALATTILTAPSALLITVAPADDLEEAYAQLIRIQEVYAALFQHAIMLVPANAPLSSLVRENPFDLQSLRFAILNDGAVAIYVPGTLNQISAFRTEFPVGLVRG